MKQDKHQSEWKERLNKKLLVEGNDDRHVIWALCKQFNIEENFDVIDCEGIDNLFDDIPLRYKQSDVDTIGIVIDANSDISKRWNKLKNIFLDKLNIKLPEKLPKKGLVIKEIGEINTGIWIMPDNNLNGMLEDFISFLIPDNDNLRQIIDKHLETIEAQNLNKYEKTIHHQKAFIHSWLAVQEVPGTPLGQSITKRYLDTEVEICLNFINWLNLLFGT